MENNKDLFDKIDNIKNKSEERMLILDEEFNNLGKEFDELIEKYNINEYNDNIESNENIDIFSLQQYIIDYINNERENSLDNLNNIFNKIIENINQKFDTSKDNKNIKSSLIMIREEFIKKCKEIENKNDESEFQSKEIDNKIKTQTFEQFENINNRIMKEILTDNKEKDTIINYSQKYLIEIKKQMKLEKIKR